MDARQELKLLIEARTPIIYIRSYEEDRVKEFLDKLVCELNLKHGTGKHLAEWTMSEKLKLPVPHQSSPALITKALVNDRVYVPGGLQYLANCPVNYDVMVVAYDLHLMYAASDAPLVTRYLKDFARKCRTESSDPSRREYKTLVMVSPTYEIPRELEKDIEMVDFPVPDFDELAVSLKSIAGSFRSPGAEAGSLPGVLSESGEIRDTICRAGRGLTGNEFSLTVRRMFCANRIVHRDLADFMLREKQQIIQKSEILEFFPAQVTLADVGGLDAFKSWLAQRQKLIEARPWEKDPETGRPRTGIPLPKGVLLVGASGGGKSLMAKATAGTWKLPLLRLDMGKVFSQYLGETERRIRQALSLAESMAPCILWLDEIEKGMAGARNQADSGASARTFGTFLTWMQEKQSMVFLMATANSIRFFADNFPEFLRKGRFDNIFFVDVPGGRERRDILAIHLSRHIRQIRRNGASIDPDELESLLNAELAEAEHRAETRSSPPENLIGLSERFTGAEIEHVINSAAEEAYARANSEDEFNFNYEDMAERFKGMTPMYAVNQGGGPESASSAERLEELKALVLQGFGGRPAN